MLYRCENHEANTLPELWALMGIRPFALSVYLPDQAGVSEDGIKTYTVYEQEEFDVEGRQHFFHRVYRLHEGGCVRVHAGRELMWPGTMAEEYDLAPYQPLIGLTACY